MRASFYNLGCKLNYAEISQVQKQFEDAGFDIVDFNDKSDVVLINTCTVTHNADADSRKYIRRAIRNNPEAFIGVMGCYSQLKPNEIVAIEGVDAVLGTNNKFNITELIGNFKKKDKPEVFIPDLDDMPFHFASSVDNDSRTRIVFKIQDGCDYVCTYCTIPMARGASRSMDFDKLKVKLKELDHSDFHEIVLSGVNVGEYRAMSGENFTDVIRYIAESNFSFRTRISSIEPNLVTDDIIKLTKDSEGLCDHFHIPLQSGSPDILKAMKRRYNASKFEELIYKIKEEIPDCCLGIDVIEGFPGESEEHFKQTFDLLEKLPVSYLHVFSYSERLNTPASEYGAQVNTELRKKRTQILRRLSENKKAKFIDSQLGKDFFVVPEKIDKKRDAIIMEGLTGNYVKVTFQNDNEKENPQFVRLLSRENMKAIGEKINSI